MCGPEEEGIRRDELQNEKVFRRATIQNRKSWRKPFKDDSQRIIEEKLIKGKRRQLPKYSAMVNNQQKAIN